jgi:hypothetical protein
MKSIISRILFSLLLISFISEKAAYMADSQDIHFIQVDSDDPEKKSGENKTEKEDEKDKTLYFQSAFIGLCYAEIEYKRNNMVITSEFLSLPEIPPDRA